MSNISCLFPYSRSQSGSLALQYKFCRPPPSNLCVVGESVFHIEAMLMLWVADECFFAALAFIAIDLPKAITLDNRRTFILRYLLDVSVHSLFSWQKDLFYASVAITWCNISLNQSNNFHLFVVQVVWIYMIFFLISKQN